MNRIKISIYLLVIALIIFFADLSLVSADQPKLPSCFYGTVKVNGENAIGGTIISAWINGDEVASTEVKFADGDSVYSLDILWIEGIDENDPINFYIDDVLADHIDAFWKSGTNTPLDLSVETEEGYRIFLPLILH